jgi:RNA-directed DNA polymerase
MKSLREIEGSVDSSQCTFQWKVIGKKGKERLIGQPSDEMRILHYRLMRRLSDIGLREVLESAHGGVPYRSIMTNAYAHTMGVHFYQTDITDAYPGTPLNHLADQLYALDPSLGTPSQIEAFLWRYCASEEGGLVVGAPASTALFNIYCSLMLDPHLRALCTKVGTIYTRFVDDLTFSSVHVLPTIWRRHARDVIDR